MPGAAIIFSDIVGFSELNDDDQISAFQSLSADLAHELYAFYAPPGHPPAFVTLPTGDGMAVALLETKERPTWAPTLFALLIRLASWSQNNHRLRIGVHYGPVAVVRDINGNANVVGAHINIGQRIMDSAHPGQCLFSQEAQWHFVGRGNSRYSNSPASDLEPFEFDGPYQLIVKHGVKLNAYAISQRGKTVWNTLEPSIRGEIQGKVTRTKFIIKELRDAFRRSNQPTTIYERSLFSSFGIADDGQIRSMEDRDEEYEKLKLEQRSCFFDLAKEERTTIKLILNLDASLPDPLKKAKLETLLSYLTADEIKTKSNFFLVDTPYQGPNRLIIGNSLLIDGYRLDHSTGYPISMAVYDRSRVEAGVNELESVIAKSRAEGQTTISVIEKIRKMVAEFEFVNKSVS